MSDSDTGLHITLPEKNTRQLLGTWEQGTGKVELDIDTLSGPFDIHKSPGFATMTKKLEYSIEIWESWSGSTPFINERDIQGTLESILQKSRLDGFIVVTWDAFPVLEASRNGKCYNEAMPGIGILLTEVVKRAGKENILSGPDEMTIKGLSGEFIIIRYFQNLEWQFILMAYAREKCAYRQATNCVMQLCEPILADFVYI